MLRRKGLIISGLVAIFIMVGSTLLVKTYFADAAQKLLSEMTDMGIVMEDIEFHYSPLPSLRIHNLQVQNGPDTVSIPLLEVYPDLTALLGGEIKLRHVVLNDPDIKASAHRSSPAGDTGHLILPESFPNRIDVVTGRVQLTNSHPAEPITVSASLEKESQGFAFNVRNAEIPELGFRFSGRLDMISTAPLKLDLQATECAIDPASFIGFLTGFGYMENGTIPELSQVARFETTALDINVDSAAETMLIKAGGLVLDSTSGKNLSLSLNQGGAMELTLEEAMIDAGELYAMAQKSERGRNATASLCLSAKLKSIKPRGTLILKNMSLHSPGGAQKSSAMSGKMTVAAKDLVLELESLKGRKQELSIAEIDADIELQDGKPVVSVRRFNVASATGGSCSIIADLAFPFKMRQFTFKAEAVDFSIFDYIITCEAEKKNPFQTFFDTQLAFKDTQISASGRLNTPRTTTGSYEAYLKSLSIRRPNESSKKAASAAASPFDFGPLLNRGMNGKASIHRFYYNDWPFSDVAIYLHSGKSKAVVKASGNLFHLNLNADLVMSRNEMAAQCNIKGRGASLPSLIACFAKDLSVSLRGRIYMNANLFAQGANTTELTDSIQGDATVKVDNLKIYNLANLDPRIGFFIDFLDAVSASPEAGEGLSFDSANLRAAMNGKNLLINSFRFNGKLLQAWGDGSYSMDKKHLKLDGQVRSMLGIVNSFNVDRKLES